MDVGGGSSSARTNGECLRTMIWPNEVMVLFSDSPIDPAAVDGEKLNKPKGKEKSERGCDPRAENSLLLVISHKVSLLRMLPFTVYKTV